MTIKPEIIMGVCAALIFMFGVSVGHRLWPPLQYATWLYYSVENGETIAKIRPDGNGKFGRRYNRKEESRKFAEMAKQLLRDPSVPPICTSIHFNGFGQLPCPACGRADPADTRTEERI